MVDAPLIFVVDDDTDSRESACALIQQMALQVRSFSSAEQFLEEYDGYRPACLLTDHRMLGMTGVELLEALRSKGVTLSVIVMTAFAETDLTVRAIRSGAVTLLEKPFTNAKLWNAIRDALAEDRDTAADEARQRRIRAKLDMLTSGELDVLKLMLQGEANKGMATRLEMSVRTIETRRASVFEKMQVSSIAELVQLVMSVELPQSGSA
ncbi:MAG: response regulator transcription factor [Planctomycetaceae bacterium]|nr:response regulator transcription factor [Planctomycetaceae bacterium]